MSPTEKNIVKPKQKITNAAEKVKIVQQKFSSMKITPSKYYKHKINIPVENLIVNNLIPKKNDLAKKMRVENWILYKHLYWAENDRPDLGGRQRGPSKC